MKRRIWLLPLIAVQLAGCNQPDRESFFQIKTGMSPRQVHEILGTPMHSETGTVGAYTGLTERWHGKTEHYTVQYLNNEVKLTSITPQ